MWKFDEKLRGIPAEIDAYFIGSRHNVVDAQGPRVLAELEVSVLENVGNTLESMLDVEIFALRLVLSLVFCLAISTVVVASVCRRLAAAAAVVCRHCQLAEVLVQSFRRS